MRRLFCIYSQSQCGELEFIAPKVLTFPRGEAIGVLKLQFLFYDVKENLSYDLCDRTVFEICFLRHHE